MYPHEIPLTRAASQFYSKTTDVLFANRQQLIAGSRVGQFFSTVAQAQEVGEFELEDFIAQDDRVFVLPRCTRRRL